MLEAMYGGQVEPPDETILVGVTPADLTRRGWWTNGTITWFGYPEGTASTEPDTTNPNEPGGRNQPWALLDLKAGLALAEEDNVPSNDFLLSHVIITPSRLYPAEELEFDTQTEPDTENRVRQGGFEWTHDGGPDDDYPIDLGGANPSRPWHVIRSVSGWDAYGSSSPEGSRHLRWYPPSDYAGHRVRRTRGHSIYQDLTLTPGRMYLASYRLRASADSNQMCRIFFTAIDKAGSVLSDIVWAPNALSVPTYPDWGFGGMDDPLATPRVSPPLSRVGDTWYQQGFAFRMPSGARICRITIEMGAGRPDGASATGTFPEAWGFDDFVIYPSPEVDPEVIIPAAIFTGVVKGFDENRLAISGPGMAFWLGDEDNKGYVYETPLCFIDATLTEVIETMFENFNSIQVGDVTEPDPPLLFNTYCDEGFKGFWYQTPRQILDRICKFFGVSWKVSPTGVIDIGPDASLFTTEPTIVAIRRHALPEVAMRGLKATHMQRIVNLDNFATRTLVIGTWNGIDVAIAGVDGPPTVYRDFFGNPVNLTQMIDEPQTALANELSFAIEHQKRAIRTDLVDVDTGVFDLGMALQPGDYVWAWDPVLNITDKNNQILFQGQIICPVKYRVSGRTWPIRAGMGVYFRRRDGVIIDLSPWIEGEDEAINLQRQPEAPFPDIPTSMADLFGLDEV